MYVQSDSPLTVYPSDSPWPLTTPPLTVTHWLRLSLSLSIIYMFHPPNNHHLVLPSPTVLLHCLFMTVEPTMRLWQRGPDLIKCHLIVSHVKLAGNLVPLPAPAGNNLQASSSNYSSVQHHQNYEYMERNCDGWGKGGGGGGSNEHFNQYQSSVVHSFMSSHC